jgi:transcriptional regulator with XRE-family HTH domain
MKIFFDSNLRLLRKRKNLTQEDLANEVKSTRSTINNYENGIAPSLENLLVLSDHFGISMDTLFRVDLSKLSQFQLLQLERQDNYIKGTYLRVLTATVDSNNRDNIELVGHKAKAGYTAGYNDPEFISGLPTFQLPFLSREKKYRMFQLDGDSMLPIPDKAYVVGEFLQDWHEIKDGYAYIFLTKEDGIVFKVAYNQIRKKKNILLRSLNSIYKSYEMDVQNILEVWSFVNYSSSQLPSESPDINAFMGKLDELKNEAIKFSVK